MYDACVQITMFYDYETQAMNTEDLQRVERNEADVVHCCLHHTSVDEWK